MSLRVLLAAAAALTGVPRGAAMLMPSFWTPPGCGPKPATICPLRGQSNVTGPAGSGAGVAAACCGGGCGAAAGVVEAGGAAAAGWPEAAGWGVTLVGAPETGPDAVVAGGAAAPVAGGSGSDVTAPLVIVPDDAGPGAAATAAAEAGTSSHWPTRIV